jgi:hypothetical protein
MRFNKRRRRSFEFLVLSKSPNMPRKTKLSLTKIEVVWVDLKYTKNYPQEPPVCCRVASTSSTERWRIEPGRRRTETRKSERSTCMEKLFNKKEQK